MMYNVDYSALGKRIRSERRRQELTQGKLAEMAEISESFMGQIERGGRILSIETLTKLANALNMSIEYILCGEHNHHKLLSEIHDALLRMHDHRRKTLLSMMKTLVSHSDSWLV